MCVAEERDTNVGCFDLHTLTAYGINVGGALLASRFEALLKRSSRSLPGSQLNPPLPAARRASANPLILEATMTCLDIVGKESAESAAKLVQPTPGWDKKADDSETLVRHDKTPCMDRAGLVQRKRKASPAETENEEQEMGGAA